MSTGYYIFFVYFVITWVVLWILTYYYCRTDFNFFLRFLGCVRFFLLCWSLSYHSMFVSCFFLRKVYLYNIATNLLFVEPLASGTIPTTWRRWAIIWYVFSYLFGILWENASNKTATSESNLSDNYYNNSTLCINYLLSISTWIHTSELIWLKR